MKFAKCILFSLAFFPTCDTLCCAANPKKVFKPNEMIGPLQKFEPMLDLRTSKPITLKGFATTKVKATQAPASNSAPIRPIVRLPVKSAMTSWQLLEELNISPFLLRQPLDSRNNRLVIRLPKLSAM